MVTFAELVKTIDHLSEDEMEELREILRRKKEEEIFKAVEEARRESKEGKTVALSSPEEIKLFFEKIMKENSYI